MFKENISVCAFTTLPYVITNKSHIINGIEKYLLYSIANWSVRVIILPPYSYSASYDYLKNNSADLALGGHFIRGRQENVDISYPYASNYVTLVVPKPTLVPLYAFILHAFSLNVWMCIVALAIITSGVYSTFSATEPSNFGYYLLNITGTLLSNIRMELSKHPRMLPVFLLLNIFALLCQTNYSAGLTLIMTTPKYSKPITTFKDVYNNVLNINDPSLQELNGKSHKYLQLIQRSASFMNRNIEKQAYFANVMAPNVFLHNHSVGAEKMQSLMVLSEYISHIYSGIAVKKHSSLLVQLEHHLRMCVESGLVAAWFKFTLYQNMGEFVYMSSFYSNVKRDFEKHPLDLEHLQGVFYVLIVGCFVSSVVFLLEIVNQSMKN